MSVYLYDTAFNYLEFGYAAAMSVGLFVVIVIFSFRLFALFGPESDRISRPTTEDNDDRQRSSSMATS